ncbi:DUF3298 domain-containing protein [bacterium]|nr:MAG: DUF3298 domain-containing protein [bacterium]
MLSVLITLALQAPSTVPADFVAKSSKGSLWDAAVYTPRLKTPSGKALAAAVAKDGKTALNQWVTEVQQGLKSYKPDMVQSYESKPEYAYERGRIASARMFIYYFTGGAHPNNMSRNYTYWDSKPAKLADFFTPGFDAARHINYALMERLVNNPQAPAISDGTVRELSPAQLEQFVVTPKGLVWTFSTYELGPYVVGSASQLLRPEDLGPNFRVSMLQGR